jgi:hypothetical protein
MSPGPSSSGSFVVQPTTLNYAARLLEEIAGELNRLAGAFGDAFHAARAAAGEPDLERCLGLAALDFDEFTRALAAASSEEAYRLRMASIDYVTTDQDAAAGFDLTSIPGTAAAAEGPASMGGPR